MHDKTATIEVRTSYIWLSFLQGLCRPVIEIDGMSLARDWGSHSFFVAAGQHTIKAYHRWMFFPQAFASSISVIAAEGQTIRLHWHTGWLVMSPGQWTEL